MLPLLLAACSSPSPSPADGPSRAPDDTGPVDSAGDTAATPAGVLVNELVAAGTDGDWLELHNAGDEDLDLGGHTMSDDWTDPARHTLPAGTVVPAHGWLVLAADESSEAGHLPFALAEDGEGVGLFDPAGDVVDWVVFPALGPDAAWARIPDGGEAWEAVDIGTPGAANRRLTRVDLGLVASGDTWRYDDGGTDLGDAWRAPDYDDQAWASGPSPLGYGDTHTTTLSYGADASAKHPTTYLRLAFRLDDVVATDLAEATLSLVADDGALVWLNGEEAARLRLAEGDVTYDTLASVTASGADETAWNDVDLDLTLVRDGVNVLAVEVHQVSLDSSDLNFDLALSATALVPE